MNKLRLQLDRARQMNAGELLDRSRQALAKRSEAALVRLGYSFAERPTHTTTLITAPGNFFFTPASVDSILALIKQRLPGRAEQIVQEADSILQHKFSLLGYDSLDYSSASGTIDWHWDPVHDKRAPKKSFHRVRYLDYDECGDSKVIWELNRHQHFLTLAKAFRLTRDRRYSDEIFRQRHHWESENSYAIGINWASSLEVAFRSLSWLWTYYLLHTSSELADRRREWLVGLSLHGRYIEKYLSTYFSPNTHLLGEGVAIFFLGVLCPELRSAERWKSLGLKIVLQEAERQVQGDGFHFEQSTYYHVYALDFFLHTALLARANLLSLPKRFEQTIEKMLNALYLLSRHGPPPQFGDDDGGRVFDPRRNRAQHLLDPLATGAILFCRSDFKTLVGTMAEEALWLLGEKGVELWDGLAKPSIEHRTTALPQAGYFLLSTQNTQLIADAGPVGPHGAGHGHADALSVCLQSKGQSLLIDCGSSEYIGPNGDRTLFRGTGKHNTLRVDGLNQAETVTAFSWRRLPRPHVEKWIQAKSFDLLVAAHDGYHRLPEPVSHRRWIVSLKTGIYLVWDVIEGPGKHRLDLAWHLAPELERVEAFIFRSKETGQGIGLFQAGSPGWNARVQRTFWSPMYGRQDPTTSLTFSMDAAVLPVESVVLLVPFKDIIPRSDSIKIAHAELSKVSSYECAVDKIEYSFIFNQSGSKCRVGSFATDAKFVYHKRGPGLSEEQLMFCNGSYAKRGPGVELCASREMAWAELLLRNGSRAIDSSDNSALCDQPADGRVEPIATFFGEA